MTSLLNYTDRFKNRVQGFLVRRASAGPLLTPFSPSLCWYTSKHFYFYLRSVLLKFSGAFKLPETLVVMVGDDGGLERDWGVLKMILLPDLKS